MEINYLPDRVTPSNLNSSRENGIIVTPKEALQVDANVV